MADEYVLNVWTSPDGDEVFVHADAAGLDQLIRELQQLRTALDSEVCEHFHLMSEKWGGEGLTDPTLEKEGHPVFHLKVCGWTDEWARRHGLKPAMQ